MKWATRVQILDRSCLQLSFKKAQIFLFSLKLWVNRSVDWVFYPWKQLWSWQKKDTENTKKVDRKTYVEPSISFQTFFVQAFKIVVDSWKFTMLLLCIAWDDWAIFRISSSKEQLQQQLEYTLLKPDCHSWWISKMQSETLEVRYAIKLCFKLEKKATETYGMLQTAFRPSCMNQASIFEWYKRFKKGRESARDDESCWRSKEVNRLQLIGQRVSVRVTILRF